MAPTKTMLLAMLAGLAAGPRPATAQKGMETGLHVGQKIPGAFQPLNVNGERAGEPYCLVCENGLNPVVMIFARRLSDPLVDMLVKLDAAAQKHRAHALGCFVVFLGKQEDLEKPLVKLAAEKKLANLILSIDAPSGPEGYTLPKEDEVTVILYTEHVVRARHASRPAEWSAKATDRVLADLPKILPK